MTESRIEILVKIIGFPVVAFSIVLAVMVGNRHDNAVLKLEELAKQHKEPDSTLRAILTADSLYMYSSHR